ncbi:unnamed protein product [Schistosoma mattheei]|uniref:Uncharacterized protein n=1 Tax=Schistosoma mattheei TaxID=31246 RepID=A0A183PIM3_9TREM|nr:unnamed protein product [Schistosoma mattheei]
MCDHTWYLMDQLRVFDIEYNIDQHPPFVCNYKYEATWNHVFDRMYDTNTFLLPSF